MTEEVFVGGERVIGENESPELARRIAWEVLRLKSLRRLPDDPESVRDVRPPVDRILH